MLRAMYSASFVWRFGLTENCSSSAGHTPPTTSEDTSISTAASTGTRKSLYTTDAKNAAATSTAMTVRITLAGSDALTVV